MTAYKDRLRELEPDSLPMYTKEYKEQIWTILIACGGATKRQEPPSKDHWRNDHWGSYYGSTIDLDHVKSVEILDAIKEHGVDWEACSDPAQNEESRFNGTFTDTQLYVRFLVGELVLNNGTRCWWGSMFDGDDFGSLIRTITKLRLNLDEALEELEDRLTNPEWHDSHFSYHQGIPAL